MSTARTYQSQLCFQDPLGELISGLLSSALHTEGFKTPHNLHV